MIIITDKPAHITQSPVLKDHFFIVLS